MTPEAVAILSNDAEIVRPWDIVWVLQAALDRKNDRLPLTESDVEALVAEGEQAVWTRQRQNLIKVEPAAEQLLESIGTFFSAGVTPRQSSILRYAAYRMPNVMRPGQKRLYLRQAANTCCSTLSWRPTAFMPSLSPPAAFDHRCWSSTRAA